MKRIQNSYWARFALAALVIIGSTPVSSSNARVVAPVKSKAAVSESALRTIQSVYIRVLAKSAAAAIGIKGGEGKTYSGLSTAQAATLPAIVGAFGTTLYPKAVKVAYCESRLHVNSVSHNRDGSSDLGLFQLNNGGTMQRLKVSPASAKIATVNANAAYRLYKDRGWEPWTCASVLKSKVVKPTLVRTVSLHKSSAKRSSAQKAKKSKKAKSTPKKVVKAKPRKVTVFGSY